MPERAVAKVVLIVEDEAVIALEIEDALTANGFVCIHAADRTEVEVAPFHGLALAVVDLRLRGRLQGQDIIRLLRSRIRDLPVIVVTGYVASAPEADLRGLGGPTARLHKPVPASELQSAVRYLTTRDQRHMTPHYGRRGSDRCGLAGTAMP